MNSLSLNLRRQRLEPDERGYIRWITEEETKTVPASRTALLLCDVWDAHWCRGAAERLEAMIPRMEETVRAARSRGIQIIHSPSETMEFYAGHPARRRIQETPRTSLPPLQELPDPPLPIDDSDNGPDTGEIPWYKAWTRQHPGISIDPERDVISDDGEEITSFLLQQNIALVLVMGVHTNMCVLHRPFGIKNMVRRGIPAALVRDLTDTMYNPAMRPYVSHEEGTRLVIGFIEKFWCPTLHSEDFFR